MHPYFSVMDERWFHRAFVYTGSVTDREKNLDFRYRYEQVKGDDGDALVGLEDAHDGGLHGARPRGCEEHAARGFRRAEQTEHQLLVLEHRLGELRGAEVRGALTADL